MRRFLTTSVSVTQLSFFVVSLSIFTITVSATTLSKKFEFNPEQVKKIKVIGLSGDVRFQKSSSKKVQLLFQSQKNIEGNSSNSGKSPNSNWEIIKEETDTQEPTLKVRASELTIDERSEKSTGGLSGQNPKVDLIIQGPAVPVDLFWRQGNVKILGWDEVTKVRLLSGFVTIQGGLKTKDVTFQKGRLEAKGLKGQLRAETYDGEILVSDAEGGVRLKSFAGDVKVLSSSGKLQISAHSGKIFLANNTGDLQFSVDKASMNVSEFEGVIDGHAGNSSVRIRYKGKANVKVRSLAGLIRIDNPRNSGAQINVGSEEGDLRLPKAIKRVQTPYLKIGRGRLQGQIPGRVYVRTKSGGVVLR